jgi:hypothetical protein
MRIPDTWILCNGSLIMWNCKAHFDAIQCKNHQIPNVTVDLFTQCFVFKRSHVEIGYHDFRFHSLSQENLGLIANQGMTTGVPSNSIHNQPTI